MNTMFPEYSGFIVYSETSGMIYGWGDTAREAWVKAITHVGNNDWGVLSAISDMPATGALMLHLEANGMTALWDINEENVADIDEEALS